MEIKTLSDFSKLIDVCLKKGIESLKISDGVVEIKLKDTAQPRTRKRKLKEETSTESPETQGPSDEELMFWSSPSVEH